MTDEQLAEIEARWAAATPGPWKVERLHPESMHNDSCYSPGPAGPFTLGSEAGQAEIIGNLYDFGAFESAPADVAALIAEVKRLREDIEYARDLALEQSERD